MVQRVLSAKDLNHGRWGALFAGLLKLPVIYIMVFPGTMARVLYNDEGGLIRGTLENADDVYPSLIFDLMPVGLTGLMFAGLMAAMASSISATLNSASTLITMDFVRTIFPKLTSKQLVTVGKFSTVVLIILGAIIAPSVAMFPSLFDYLQFVISYIAPPVVAVFLTGLFWKRANAHGAFSAFMVGFVALIFLVFVSGPTIADTLLAYYPAASTIMYTDRAGDQIIHFLYIAPALFLLCTIVMIVVSLMTSPPPAEKIEAYVWKKELFDQETQELQGVPWYQNFRYLSIILLIITAIIVISYW